MHRPVKPIENLTFVAIMAAINVIVALFSAFLPLASLLLVLVLPAVSALVALACKPRYYLIYAVSSIVLSFVAVAFLDPEMTLFYVIPAVIEGLAFGFLIKRKFPTEILLFGASILQWGLSYGILGLIQLIYGVRLTVVFATVIGVVQSSAYPIIMPTFFYVIALAQTLISYLVIASEADRLGYDVNARPLKRSFFVYGAFGSTAGIVLFGWLFPPLAYLLVVWLIYFSFFCFRIILTGKSQKQFVFLGISELIALFLFGFLYGLLPSPLGLLSAAVFFLPAVLMLFVEMCFTKRHETLQ